MLLVPPADGTVSLLAELRALREGLRYADAAHNGVERWQSGGKFVNRAHESVYAVIGRYSEFWNSLSSDLQTRIGELHDFNFFHTPLFNPNPIGGWGECIQITGMALERFISNTMDKILEIDKTINNDINAQKFCQTRDRLIEKCGNFLNNAPLEINPAQTGYIQPHKRSTFSESHINARTGINSEDDSMQIIGNLIKFVTAEVPRLTRQTSGTLIKDKISQYTKALTQLTELHSHKESVTPAELKKCLDAVSRVSDYNTSKVRRGLVKAGIFSESSLARNTTSHDGFERLKTETCAATENLNIRIQ